MSIVRRSVRDALRRSRTGTSLLVIAACFVAGSSLAAAQSITGVVLEDGTDAPLAGAQITLVDAEGATRAETLTNDEGAFYLEVPGPGEFFLRGTLLGYADIASARLEVEAGEEIVVEVRMAVEAVPLDPIVVKSRERRLDPALEGFYDRMGRGERSGLGHFISRSEIDRYTPSEATDLLRMTPGVRVVRGRAGSGAGLRMTSGCIPAVYVDGIQINRYPLTYTSLDDMVTAMSIEGIEVYRGPAANIGSYYDPSGCGLVLVWTRRGHGAEGPWSWTKFLAGLGLVGVILLFMR